MAEVKHDAVAVRDGAFVEGIVADNREQTIGFGARVRKTFQKFARIRNRVVRNQHVRPSQAILHAHLPR